MTSRSDMTFVARGLGSRHATCARKTGLTLIFDAMSRNRGVPHSLQVSFFCPLADYSLFYVISVSRVIRPIEPGTSRMTGTSAISHRASPKASAPLGSWVGDRPRYLRPIRNKKRPFKRAFKPRSAFRLLLQRLTNSIHGLFHRTTLKPRWNRELQRNLAHSGPPDGLPLSGYREPAATPNHATSARLCKPRAPPTPRAILAAATQEAHDHDHSHRTSRSPDRRPLPARPGTIHRALPG